MKILSIESSCDETSAAVVEIIQDRVVVHSNVTATSLAIHAKTGGIIPENAAREQVKYIIPVIEKALIESERSEYSENQTIRNAEHQTIRKSEFSEKARDVLNHDIDAIAVTYGPGLIGSLLVGVETAKTLSYTLNKPLLPVNHLLAHIFANFIEHKATGHKLLATNKARSQKPDARSFPFIGLIVSGGHTDLLYFKSVKNFKWLGGTRDDAAGEAFDKIGRLLGLTYPAGAEIEKRAKLGSKTKIKFTSPIMDEETFDFSFSGLKSEVMRFVQKHNVILEGVKRPIGSLSSDSIASLQNDKKNMINEICFAVQKAILDVLVKKTLAAAEQYKCKTILLGGGVSANSTLIKQLKSEASSQLPEAVIFSPAKIYCTDNAAMIGAYALLHPEEKSWEKVFAEPDLYFD